MNAQSYSLFLAVSVATMTLTPLVMALASRLASSADRWPVPSRLKAGFAFVPDQKPVQQGGHLIVVGYGFNGQNVARAAAAFGLPYTILETQPDLVRQGRDRGEPIHFGDATQEQVLTHVHVQEARVLVIAISDPAATRLVLSAARRLSPTVHIIIRTRYIRELKPLYELGANEVIPEEYETSVEIFTRVLNEYLVPREDIERLVAQMRGDGYEMMRSLSLMKRTLNEAIRLQLPEIELMTVTVEAGVMVHGHTIAELELRKRHGVTLLLIRRGEQRLLNPDPATRLEAGDVITLVGTMEHLANVGPMFAAGDRTVT